MNKVGMPESLWLQEYGRILYDAFGSMPYQVGSSLQKGDWRDVDIRIIMNDEDYERMGFGDPDRSHDNPKWVALVMAFSELGRKITGLPIDFQIQQRSFANRIFNKAEHVRSAIAIPSIWRAGKRNENLCVPVNEPNEKGKE